MAENAILADFRTNQHTISKRKELIHESQRSSTAYILYEGWLCSYKQLPDGGRQVIDLRLPGDFVGLTSLFPQTSDRDVEALTDSLVVELSKAQLIATMQQSWRFAELVLWSFARDEAIAAQHLANVGRRSALVRTVHFFLELGYRLQDVGRGSTTKYECPLSQQLLADALGLTSIHINRILRHLRESDLLTFSGGTVELLNVAALTQLAGFDPSYLGPPPR
jgi:CRP-like cAMP-binding protein